jgi:hypothetical protein
MESYGELVYEPEEIVMVATGKLSGEQSPTKAILRRQKAPISDGRLAVDCVEAIKNRITDQSRRGLP